MITTPWAHLPNAKHIDAVLADIKKQPKTWLVVYRGVLSGTSEWRGLQNAREAAKRASDYRAMCIENEQEYMRNAPGLTHGWVPASDAMDALIAWDDSADLLDLPADTLRTMIDLAPEPVCHQAVLLLARALVMESS